MFCWFPFYIQMPSLQHRHLLHFIAADLKQRPSGLEYWLVTEYHESGDLRRYLQENSITVSSAICFSWSIASGLAELHEFRLVTSDRVHIAPAVQCTLYCTGRMLDQCAVGNWYWLNVIKETTLVKKKLAEF